MKKEETPEWILSLEEEDLRFIKKFILASGSLKQLAGDYSVTYPTIRLRLDRLIEKIKASEEEKEDDEFVELVKELALDDKFDLETAKKLIGAYRRKGK